MANLPMGGWVTPVCIMGDVKDPLGLHLNQNDLKLGRKWLSYGQFTNHGLDDSSVHHEGKKGLIGAWNQPCRLRV